ncbi:hypothetical protein F4803DRAFT_432639 [Xylaria telfairii]|nr:hypothetical protein F4803DRAFT_432639 [Xylaria telfairii]
MLFVSFPPILLLILQLSFSYQLYAGFYYLLWGPARKPKAPSHPTSSNLQLRRAANAICKSFARYKWEKPHHGYDAKRWEMVASQRTSEALEALGLPRNTATQKYPDIMRVIEQCSSGTVLRKLKQQFPTMDLNGYHYVPTSRHKSRFVECALRAAIKSYRPM